jgi:hypothetical protein
MPVVAILSNLGFWGPSIGEVSNRYPTYVVPAGYAFSIWSLIYALVAGYGFWQASASQRENPLLRRIGWFTASAALACSIWAPVFQRSLFKLSVGVMLWLLISLIVVVARIDRHSAPFSRAERWLVYGAFSVFLGWITAATVANVAQTLTAGGWDGWGLPPKTWAMMALIMAGVISASVTVATKGNAPYALTVVWALVAVAVNQFSRAVATSSTRVGVVAVGMAVLLGIALLISRNQREVRRNLDNSARQDRSGELPELQNAP